MSHNYIAKGSAILKSYLCTYNYESYVSTVMHKDLIKNAIRMVFLSLFFVNYFEGQSTYG